MLHFPLAVIAALTLLPAQSGDFRLQTVLPSRLLAAEGNTGANAPFRAGPRRIQLAYGRDMLDQDGPVRIVGLALRPDAAMPSLTNLSFTVALDLSTSTRAPDALSHTFDTNHGADRSQVFSGIVTTSPTFLGAPPRRFELKFALAEEFTWDPRCGPLLLDFQVFSATAPGFIADGVSDGSESYGQVLNTTSTGATTANQPATGVIRRVPVLDLLLDTQLVPVNQPLAGGVPTDWPWASQGVGALRVQSFYPSFNISRGLQRITRLGWRPEPGVAYSSRTYDVTVTLSTGSVALPQSASPVFASNHGNDQTVVFDGLWTPPPIPAGSPPGYEASLPFSREFSYDSREGSLVVDVQVHNIAGPVSARFDGLQSPNFGSIFSAGSTATTAAGSSVIALALALGAVRSPVMPIPGFNGSALPSSLPWSTTSALRVMAAYDRPALGSGEVQVITHLSWQMVPGSNDYGPSAFDATIDLSTGTNPASATSLTFDTNHGPDRLRAFDGVVVGRYREGIVSYADFSIHARLDTPFRWDPTQGPLIVDIRTPNGLTGGRLGTPQAGRQETSVYTIFGLNSNGLASSGNACARSLRLNGAPRGTVVPYGVGCGSAQTPLATADHDPAIGTADFACHLRRAPANRLAPCVVGLAPATISLAPFGAAGCFLLTSGDLGALWFLTDSAGEAVFPIPIPNAPAFIGFTFFQQWLVFEPSAPGGLIATGGLKLTIGG